MRKGIWSAAAVIVLSAILGPTVRAADEVTMGSPSEPNTFKFFPAEITVPVGATVTWRNLSDLQHDVKAVNNAFASPLLDKGQTFAFKFDAPGPVTYYCTVSGHREAGMEATVNVTGGSTPTTAAPATTTTQASTTTTAKGSPASSSTTTTKPAEAGGTTTTTAGLGVTSTTQAASTTPTSAPETGDVTSTTMAAGTDGHGGEEAAAETHGSEGGSDEETNPVAVGLAGILTAALTAISLKLLTGKP